MSDPPVPASGAPPASPAPRWEHVALATIRLPVPGGWLYAIGGYEPWLQSLNVPSGTVTFVPNPRAKQAAALGLPDAALGALPAQHDPCGIIATALDEDGTGSIVWTRGSPAALAALLDTIRRHIAGDPALARDFDAWTQGEPTGEGG